MARIPMITRTATNYNLYCKVSKGDECEIVDRMITVPARIMQDERKVNAFIKSSLPDDEVFIRIASSEEVTHTYGMPESDFFKNAQIIDKNDVEEIADEAPVAAEKPAKKSRK